MDASASMSAAGTSGNKTSVGPITQGGLTYNAKSDNTVWLYVLGAAALVLVAVLIIKRK